MQKYEKGSKKGLKAVCTARHNINILFEEKDSCNMKFKAQEKVVERSIFFNFFKFFKFFRSLYLDNLDMSHSVTKFFEFA